MIPGLKILDEVIKLQTNKQNKTFQSLFAIHLSWHLRLLCVDSAVGQYIDLCVLSQVLVCVCVYLST